MPRGGIACLCLTARQLRGEYIYALDAGRLREEFVGLRLVCCGVVACEMGIATCLVGKRIDVAVCGRTETQGEPCKGAGFVLDHRQSAAQKALDLRLFAGLGLEPHE